MKKLAIALFCICCIGCTGSKQSEYIENSTNESSIPESSLGSDEWKSEEIKKIQSDSTYLRDTDFASYANETNAIMSVAIGFLSSQTPWRGYVGSYSDFYTNDKRASVPIKYIEKNAAIQLKKVLPSYRKAFAKNLANALWEQDIYVTASGDGNNILNMTGGIFAANQNISDMQNIIKDDANNFRFKHVRYRWYKGADEYTQYSFK